MILFYEVYEKETSWEGNCFRTLEECNKYIEAQEELSKIMYRTPRTKNDYEIIPHTYMSIKDLLLDEYDIEDEEIQKKLKEVLTKL